ncbi:VWA domain-containing protein [Adlercreutzia sp. ZJ138]|uniref:vWA domain-containing protein n=1 Tax=Adlercreutzia sp. ZJ138 TaxID=2709405 RepID=UPI0013EBF4EB|nr:VWA domain-containing protein [Adlercreutzia sp. ZJ138]
MKNYTELVFILDRSGSMQGLEADTIGGFNSVLAKHQEMEGNAVVSTVLFDDQTDVICDRRDIREVEPITGKEYYVRGCTALLDAVGGAIDHVSKVQKILPKSHRAKDVVFVITTDGLENASCKYSYADVKKMIEKKKKKGWEFIFMGANIDAAAEASRIGIAADHAATYCADGVGTHAGYAAMADATCMARQTGHVDASWAAPIKADMAARKHGFLYGKLGK